MGYHFLCLEDGIPWRIVNDTRIFLLHVVGCLWFNFLVSKNEGFGFDEFKNPENLLELDDSKYGKAKYLNEIYSGNAGTLLI